LRRERNPFQKLTGERERERRVAPISLLHRRERKKKWTLEKRREGPWRARIAGKRR
jgi:hypothetical protein